MRAGPLVNQSCGTDRHSDGALAVLDNRLHSGSQRAVGSNRDVSKLDRMSRLKMVNLDIYKNMSITVKR